MRSEIREVLKLSLGAWHWAAVAILLGGLMTIVAEIGSKYLNIPIKLFLDDPNLIAKQPFFYGVFELASGLIMGGTAAILLFSGCFALPSARGFLHLSGLLSALLACDDLFQIHEQAHRVHLEESVIYGAYLSLLAAILLIHRAQVARTPAFILGGAMTCYLASALLDRLHPPPSWLPGGAEALVELFAVSLWAVYFLWVAAQTMREALVHPHPVGQVRSGAVRPVEALAE